jgi:small-conductance mechanosensitive channel
MMETELTQQVLKAEFFGNTVEAYLLASGIFVGILLALWIIKAAAINRLQRRADRTATDIDRFVVGLLRHIGPEVYLVVALYMATRSLTLTPTVEKIVYFIFVVVVTFRAVQLIQQAAAHFIHRWIVRTEAADASMEVAARNITIVFRFVVWVGAVLFMLDNLGIDVTAVIAGLGIGGVAVALAAQSLFRDVFGAFAIFIDKPFKIGDFIIVGDLLGTVEYIGFKTTRVRSLSGEQLVFSNHDMIDSRIRNFKRMETRRVVFKFGVIYQTPIEQVRLIPGLVADIIREHELARFDRSHFASYGDFALVFEVVYHVLTPDFNKYMDLQQFINLRMMEEFQKRGIQFAYPTQQVYVTRADPPQP